MLLYVAYRYLTEGAVPDEVASDIVKVPTQIIQHVRIESSSPLHGLPPFALVLVAFGCLALAAAVAGLTLGLMTLDSTGLDIIIQSNDNEQAEAARAIRPVREHGNLLLVTLLLSNTLAAELLPLTLEALYPGSYFALLLSVLSLMLFGEMIPQAVCSRHPLYFGHRLIGFVKVLRIIMYPFAAPIAFFLDFMLGEELGTIYNREELKGLIDVHARSKVLTQDETTILKGALEFSLKNVQQILTPAKTVFKLDIDTVLDRDTLLSILRNGHSRVPLYDKTPNNIVCLLLVKQLILVNPDDHVPIRALISKRASNHKVRVSPALECSASTLIADLLNEFQLGRSHMALVYDDVMKPGNEREFLGIVSIEDIIEEILQEEIVDETDMFVDNTNKTKVLVRNTDGQLVRATALTASPLNPKSALNRSLRLREIDVPALRAPLTADMPSLSTDDIRIPIATENKLNPPSASEPALDRSLTSEADKDSALRKQAGGSSERVVILKRDPGDPSQAEPPREYLLGQPGRLGPLLGGVHRRSMMSLLGDEDNILPEDVFAAERAGRQISRGPPPNMPVGAYSGLPSGSSGLPNLPGGLGPEVIPMREGKVKVQMRPLPNNASSERLAVPARLRRNRASRSATLATYGSVSEADPNRSA